MIMNQQRVTIKGLYIFVIVFIIIMLSNITYSQKVNFSVFLPPIKSTDNYYNDFNTYVLPSTLFSMVTVSMIWSDIETSQGVYDFSTFDTQIQQFITAGKKVNIVTWPISPNGINTYTPAYIFTTAWASSLGASQLTVDTCSAMHGNGTPTSGMPTPYETPFKQGLKNFYTQIINHYNNNPNIGYIRLGLAVGGDFFPRCSSVMPGYTLTVWENYAKEMNDFEAALHPTVKLIQSVMLTGADVEAANAVNDSISIGIQGWQISDNTATTCTSDWCALFAQYTGKVWPLELQTINYSEADGVTTTENPTGSLIDLIPFAASHHADVLELYLVDWLLALDPNYANLNGQDIVPAYAQYALAYYNVIANASITDVNELNVDKSYAIYPNPAKDILAIESNSNKEYRLEILNLMGQTVYTSNINNKKTNINTTAFANGVYIIKLYTDKEMVVKKIVKD